MNMRWEKVFAYPGYVSNFNNYIYNYIGPEKEHAVTLCPKVSDPQLIILTLREINRTALLPTHLLPQKLGKSIKEEPWALNDL